jgi:hypothetical protein
MAVTKDRGRLKVHFFVPRILKRVNISRNEERGYPSGFKKNVIKTTVPKKKIKIFIDPGISIALSVFSWVSRFFKKSLKRKRADKVVRRIPRQRGNIPVPDLRKVPIGILTERRVVTAPKRKITIPPMISCVFNLSPLESISDCRLSA